MHQSTTPEPQEEAPASGEAGPNNPLAVEVRALREELAIQKRIAEVSTQFLRAGLEADTLDSALSNVLSICQDALSADTSVIELYDSDREELVGVVEYERPYNAEGYFRLELTESALSTLAFNQRCTIGISDVVNDPRVSQRVRSHFEAVSGIAAPLMIGSRPIGVLLAMAKNQQRDYALRDIAMMESLARQAAAAVQAHLLRERRREVEERMGLLLAHAPLGILLLNARGSIVQINEAGGEILGKPNSTFVGEPLHDFVHPEDASVLAHLAHLSEGEARCIELRLKHGIAHAELHVSPLMVSGQRMLQVFLHDITARKAALKALEAERDRAHVTLESIGDAVITATEDGQVSILNRAASELCGWEPLDARGQPVRDVLALEDESSGVPIRGLVDHCLKSRQVIELGEAVLLERTDGEKRPVELTVAPIIDDEGRSHGAVFVLHDIRQARQIARDMTYLATHDPLTGLINRSAFETELREAILEARESSKIHALCYIDLDQFKVVNDTCGHFAGDELLKQLTALLRSRVRKTDMLARLGGDEFGLFLPGCPLPRAEEIAEGLLSVVRGFRFTWEGRSFRVGASIGLAAVDANTPDLKTVLSAVDAACYVAKERGRDQVHVHQSTDHAVARRHGEVRWIQRINEAIDAGSLFLAAQPIFPVRQASSSKAYSEVLLRMRADDDEIVGPSSFLPAAERFGMMPRIDRWVIQSAMTALRRRREKGFPGTLRLGINLSGFSLGEASLLGYVIEQIETFDVKPSELCFEITETAAVANFSHAITFCSALREIGCQFALDDFGTGVSSFSYLKELPVDYIKIAGHFIRGLGSSEFDRTMVESVHRVAHVMGVQTIAECVEDGATLRLLDEIGVDFAQGHLLAVPSRLETT